MSLIRITDFINDELHCGMQGLSTSQGFFKTCKLIACVTMSYMKI